jgi:phosphatidylserine/phosphatidylglycerophosphate/cardiolipin synthase-like enzyme
VFSAIAKRQKEEPNLEIILVGNTDFEINPYHPGKGCRVLSLYANYVFRKETRLGLDMLSKSGCSYQYRTYQNKYTHNKVFIADDIIVVGTFNLHERSLEVGNDVETGIVLKNQESLIDTYVTKTVEATTSALLWS